MSAIPLHRLLALGESQANHPAVVDSGRTTTYAELTRFVRRVADRITAAAERPRVLIHLSQGMEAYAAMFATHMAGGCYTATNVRSSPARNTAVCRRFEPEVLVSTAELADSLAPTNACLIDIANLGGHAGLETVQPEHELAYVMFTSGSTGEPKGVMVSHESLAHYIDWAITAMDVGPGDHWSQHPSISFDLSVLDIYGALSSGATLHPLDNDRDRLVPADFIRRRRLTIWNSVPSVIDLMIRARHVTAERLASLRLMTFCGEPLLPHHLEAIFEAKPDVLVHNTYGPTEATVSCTLAKLTSTNYPDYANDSVAIGEAIPEMQMFLRGGNSPDEGEIVLAGVQLAKGYWKDSESTLQQFRTLRLDSEEECRAYFTGDWGVRHDGKLFCVGRIDRQVKIKGHRLELGEVDAALRTCGADAACTVAIDGALYSFIAADSRFDLNDLRRRAAGILPHHAMPAELFVIEELPRTDNNKIDFGALTRLARDKISHRQSSEP